MKLTIGEHAGFCFGVRRAVDKAFACAKEGLPCVTLGPLIHNPQEVARLESAGVRSVDSLDEVAPGQTVIIRSHGVTPAVHEMCRARGIPVIDCTCPHVAHVHQLVQENVRVIFITEHAARVGQETFERYKTDPSVILIPIPGSGGTDGLGMERVHANVEKAIGANILIDEEQ